VEQLDMGAVPVQKNENFATGGIPLQLRTNQAA
jgi:hypothetical protein